MPGNTGSMPVPRNGQMIVTAMAESIATLQPAAIARCQNMTARNGITRVVVEIRRAH